MRIQIKNTLSIFSLALLISCGPNGKEQATNDKIPVDSISEKTLKNIPKQEDQDIKNTPLTNGSLEKTTSVNEETEEIAQNFICYNGDENPSLSLSIGFDKEGKALMVKYKGQKETMKLSFIKEDYLEGGAHPTIETYYSEIYNGQKNGVYKLAHSGIWDYAEYTRSKDGKKFNFTIDHELSIVNGEYRTTPCF